MKKFTTIAFILLGALGVKAQDKWSKEPYMTRSLTNAAIKTVFVNTSGGSITVNGVEPSQARIEVYIRPNNSNDDITKAELKQRLEDNYKLEITDADHELHATAKSKFGNMNWRRSVSISFKVYVPKAVATNLSTSGGSINLDNLTGEQQFTTSGGSLHISKVVGKMKGHTSGGSISVTDSKQDIELVTSGGSITATNCDGNIELTTSGGSLKLSNLSGKVNATTSGGSIHADDVTGELITSTSGGGINLTQMACSVDASTSGGSIHAAFKQIGKYVKLNTSAGHIDLQLPGNKGLNLDLRGGRVNAELAGSFSGTKERDRLDGEYNGGGIAITARASGGSVNLKMN